MDRASLEQLRQETARYRLPTAGRKIDLIEAIVSLLENNGPALDFLGPSQAQQDSEGGAGPSRPTDPSDQSDVLRQMISTLQSVIRRQDEEREEQRRCFQEQQRQFGQLLEVFTAQRSTGPPATDGAPEPVIPDPVPSGSSQRSTPSQEAGHSRASAWTSGNPIQALASQIPEFAGREDENVRSWVRRIEKVAKVQELATE